MLAQLTGRDLTNVAVVVTRYFGGTKLGVGGLVRAYGGAVGAALDQVSLVEWVPMCELVIQHEHADSAAVERALARGGATDIDVSYSTIVERRIRIAEARRSELDTFLADGSSGRIRSEPID